MQKESGFKIDLSPGVLQELLIPTVYGPFASPLARQALAWAFDYDAMNKSFLKDFAVQAQGPIAHHIFGHDSALPMYHTDLAKAKALFAQAGVKPGTAVTLWYIAGDTLAAQIALITQGQLGQLGIQVKTVGKDGNTINTAQAGNAPASQRPNLWATNWFPDYSDPVDVITPLYRTKNAQGGAVNMGLYSNKQVDQLLAKAAVTTDAGQAAGAVQSDPVDPDRRRPGGDLHLGHLLRAGLSRHPTRLLLQSRLRQYLRLLPDLQAVEVVVDD